MDGYGSRKFIAYIVTLVLTFVSFWFFKLPAEQTAMIVTVAIGAYMAGNAAQHFAEK